MFKHPPSYFFSLERESAPANTPAAYYSAPMLVPGNTGELRVAHVQTHRVLTGGTGGTAGGR